MYAELVGNSDACTTAVLMGGSHHLLFVYGITGRDGESLQSLAQHLRTPQVYRYPLGYRCTLLVGNLIPTPPEQRVELHCWLTSAIRNGHEYQIYGHFGARRYQVEWKLLAFRGLFNTVAGIGIVRLELGIV